MCKPPCIKQENFKAMVMGTTGLLSNRLFYIISNHNYHFLIDTGAEVHVLPPSLTDYNKVENLHLE